MSDQSDVNLFILSGTVTSLPEPVSYDGIKFTVTEVDNRGGHKDYICFAVSEQAKRIRSKAKKGMWVALLGRINSEKLHAESKLFSGVLLVTHLLSMGGEGDSYSFGFATGVVKGTMSDKGVYDYHLNNYRRYTSRKSDGKSGEYQVFIPAAGFNELAKTIEGFAGQKILSYGHLTPSMFPKRINPKDKNSGTEMVQRIKIRSVAAYPMGDTVVSPPPQGTPLQKPIQNMEADHEEGTVDNGENWDE